MAGITPQEAAQAVGELIRARLLTVRGRNRYWAHDLVLAYAAELAEEHAEDGATVRSRLYDHYRQTAHAGNLLLRPGLQLAVPPSPQPLVTPEPLAGTAAATEWFTREREILRAVVEATAARGESRPAWELALSLQMCQQRLGWWNDWAATMLVALTAAQEAEDAEGMARTHHGLAGALYFLGDVPGALHHLERARNHFDQLGLCVDLAHVLKNIGVVCFARGDHVRANQHLDKALQLLRGDEPCQLRATTLAMAGLVRLELGDVKESIRLTRAARTIFRELGDLNSEGLTLTGLGRVHRTQRQYTRSACYYERGIQLLRLAGSRANVAEELVALGDVRLDMRDVAGARRSWTEALRNVDDPDLPLAALATERLAGLEAQTVSRGTGRAALTSAGRAPEQAVTRMATLHPADEPGKRIRLRSLRSERAPAQLMGPSGIHRHHILGGP